MHVSQMTYRYPGPDLKIDCLACERTGVVAWSYEEQIQETLLAFITINHARRVIVKCSECHAEMASSIPVAELEERPISEISTFLKYEASFIAKFLAVISLILAIFPIPGPGTILALIALIANYRYRAWPRTISIIALMISSIPILFLLIILIYGAIAGRN